MTIDLATPADDQTGTGTGGQNGGGTNSTVGGNGYETFNVTTSGNGTVNGTSWEEWKIPDNAARPLDADIIACAIITWLIALTFVGLRFYTRTKLNSVLGPADWCLIPSLVCSFWGWGKKKRRSENVAEWTARLTFVVGVSCSCFRLQYQQARLSVRCPQTHQSFLPSFLPSRAEPSQHLPRVPDIPGPLSSRSPPR